MKKKFILGAFAVLFVVVSALVFWGQHRQKNQELYYSGTIEGTDANLAFQISGRVRTVSIEEGQAVEAGQVLAEIDSEDFIARRLQAQAEYNRAQSTLKQVEALLELYRQSLPADVERARAAVLASRAQLSELVAGFRVQEVERAKLAVEESRAALKDARKNKDRFDRLIESGTVTERDRDSVELRYTTALKEFKRAEQTYGLVKEGTRKETVAVARQRVVEAEAALKQTRGNLNRIEATEREVEAARNATQAASAALQLAEIQVERTRLTAPFSGILVSRNLEPGEYVTPGREVLTLSDLTRVKLKIFVAETDIGRVRPGQPVEVRTDTFPDREYPGTVAYISPEAEFTPKIIQTHKERVKLVYLVKIFLENPNLELKPGMPADAWLR